YATDQSRGDHSAAILQAMHDWCAQRTTREALDALDAAGIPAGPVYSPQQALEDPQVQAMGWLTAVQDYPGLRQPALVTGLPLQLTATPGSLRTPPPQAGQHSDEVLAGLGYTSEQIAAFHARGVTG
ncbi:MAG: CoA transferase, partial [Sinobacteraceae bacterium]|nr:CoA transferase [Nevskiaceae bacterium]